jgi:hypothetical protein
VSVGKRQLRQVTRQGKNDLIIGHTGEQQLRRLFIEVNPLRSAALGTVPIAARVVQRSDFITFFALKLPAAQQVGAAERQLCQHALNLWARRGIDSGGGTEAQDLRDR